MPTPIELQESFGRRLKIARLARGFSSGREAAEILGVQENTYTTWERAEKRPNIWRLVQIKRHFGVTLDYLLDNDTSGLSVSLYRRIQEVEAELDDAK